MAALVTLAQILILVLYVGFIWKRYGVLSSISASTYELEGQSKYLFWAFLVSIGFLNLFQGLGVYGFLATASIAFTGTTVDHASSSAYTSQVHLIATVLAVVFSYVGLIAVHGAWLPLGFLVAGGVIASQQDNWIWWAEIWAFAVLFATYLIV